MKFNGFSKKPTVRKALTLATGCFAILIADAGRLAPLRAAPFPPSRPVQEAVEPPADSAPSGAWAPALLYDIISSPSPAALDSLYDAAFATGPSMVPQLVAALKDDRTAEFAAQSLAFTGGEPAFTALSKLVEDPRNLNLRRYYYGALAEIDTPQAADYLLHVIRQANNEPDRTVTEAALIALTVRSDARLGPQLKAAESKLTDPVMVDDVENAILVIQTRARFLAAHKNPGGSLQAALDLYFEPAFEESSGAPAASGSRGPATSQSRAAAPSAKVEIKHIEFSPAQSRALTRVLFQDQGQNERFWVVLQKRYGDWTVASVWLSLEEASVPASSPPGSPPVKRR